MNAKWMYLVVASTIVAVVSGPVMAQPWGGGPGLGRGPMHQTAGPGWMARGGGPMGMGPGGAALGPAMAQLNLTDEQKQAIRTICLQSRADANEVVGAIEDARTALHEAVIAGAGEEQILAAAAKLGEAIGVQAAHQAKTVAAAKAVLTGEQWAQYEKIRTAVPHVRRGMGGQGLGGGPRAGGWGLQPHEPAGLGMQGGSGPLRRGPSDQVFDTADTNKDGVLSVEEFESFRSTGRGGRGRGPRQ